MSRTRNAPAPLNCTLELIHYGLKTFHHQVFTNLRERCRGLCERKENIRMETPSIAGSEYEGTTADTCPTCGQTLRAYRISSMPFEGCPNCGGIWLVKDELRQLKNRVDGGSLRWLNDEIEAIETTSVAATERPCVKCRTVRMVSVTFGRSSVLIDSCPQCHGRWLDRGGFESIIQYLEAELRSLPSKEIERRALEDVERIWRAGG